MPEDARALPMEAASGRQVTDLEPRCRSNARNTDHGSVRRARSTDQNQSPVQYQDALTERWIEGLTRHDIELSIKTQCMVFKQQKADAVMDLEQAITIALYLDKAPQWFENAQNAFPAQ